VKQHQPTPGLCVAMIFLLVTRCFRQCCGHACLLTLAVQHIISYNCTGQVPSQGRMRKVSASMGTLCGGVPADAVELCIASSEMFLCIHSCSTVDPDATIEKNKSLMHIVHPAWSLDEEGQVKRLTWRSGRRRARDGRRTGKNCKFVVRLASGGY
jgi:hypothetical protein